MKFFSLNQLPLYTDDFFFQNLNDRKSRDAIVLFNPADALIVSPVFLRSRKSLNEHIDYIRDNNVKKAIVVAEDISFLKQCPSLEYLMIFPAISADNFDYSPIYELPNLKWLQCETIYGIDEEKTCSIDYSLFKNIKRVGIIGGRGHLNVQKAETVESLYLDFGFPNSKTLSGFIPTKNLVNLIIRQSPIKSLEGVEESLRLRRLELSYDRRLTDISALRNVSNTLKCLEIDTCGKIKDFSVFNELHNLEFLILKGSNVIRDLSFVKNMPRLKYLHLTMNVDNGDLSLCEQIPYVRIKNRRHYSHKNDELPKNYIDPDNAYPFEVV